MFVKQLEKQEAGGDGSSNIMNGISEDRLRDETPSVKPCFILN